MSSSGIWTDLSEEEDWLYNYYHSSNLFKYILKCRGIKIWIFFFDSSAPYKCRTPWKKLPDILIMFALSFKNSWIRPYAYIISGDHHRFAKEEIQSINHL